MNDQITISRTEYELLKQKERELNLLLQGTSVNSYPLTITRCAIDGCKSISVTDGGRGIDIYDGCEEFFSCDFLYPDCSEVSYCDHHVDNCFLKVKQGSYDVVNRVCHDCWLKLKDQSEWHLA